MKLLNEKQLIWSSVVANCNMNRKRNLIGINSYEKDISFDIFDFLKNRISTNNPVNWIDICCGEGNALIEAEKIINEQGLNHKIRLEGLDLVSMFQTPEKDSKITFKESAVLEWMPDIKYDLITCVHGLHYIGDKLKAIEKMTNSLKSDGFFIANIDLNNICDSDNLSLESKILEKLKGTTFTYQKKMKLLSCKGHTNFDFGFNYLGANDKAGPNYTGQEVVDSYYSKKGF